MYVQTGRTRRTEESNVSKEKLSLFLSRPTPSWHRWNSSGAVFARARAHPLGSGSACRAASCRVASGQEWNKVPPGGMVRPRDHAKGTQRVKGAEEGEETVYEGMKDED